jgi:pimeloyl-ACP methyl ester carboxylesterase
MSVLVGDIAGLLDSTGVDRAAVVGHDGAAASAWQVAGPGRRRWTAWWWSWGSSHGGCHRWYCRDQ